jgi:hypothetical protein
MAATIEPATLGDAAFFRIHATAVALGFDKQRCYAMMDDGWFDDAT